MSKKGKKTRLISYLCIAIVTFLVLIIWGFLREAIEENTDFVANTIALLSFIVAVASVFAIVLELKVSGAVQEAEFILHLNQAFVENPNYAKVYTELEESKTESRKPDLTRSEVSNYLTFFESVYILLRKQAIDIRNLDDLFAYRFFLAAHDKTIQEIKLVESPYNFRNIYCLEKIWIQYRKEKGLPVYQEENCLHDALVSAGKEKIYQELVKN